MCGIAGIWARQSDRGTLRSELQQAIARLHHRGPDDSGSWANDSGVALGHARLSILDLSASGHQPMVSADGRYVIVFNGEIYNFAEIRERLERLGHSFVGTGDTEVALHAFMQWGSDAVHQFIGMFALALWDAAEQTLELLRDRVGVKPLYFGWHDGTLCFASELKALTAFKHWKPEIDRQSLGEFLQYGYISGDRSIYQGVHKLRPGHRLRLRAGEEPVTVPYWSVLDAVASPLDRSEQELTDGLESLLVDAFRYRMVSDVPVGVYLSGGVDSSLVTALLARYHDRKIRTFTIGFRESGHDESKWAQRVADHCGTTHTEYILGQSEALQIAQDWGGLFDEPFGDTSGIPTLLVSRLAAEQVKVVLSADGGDELFAGYQSYSTVLSQLQTLKRMRAPLRGVCGASLSLMSSNHVDRFLRKLSFPAETRGDLVDKVYRWRRILQHPTLGQLVDLHMSHWRPESVRRLLGEYQPERASADSYPGSPDKQVSLWDFHHYLPEDILTKVDRTTMAVSIEGREPLLDHRVVEYAFRLPAELRRGALGPKHILKSILYRYVPRRLVDRPKQGFGIPLQEWLRGDLGHLIDIYLEESRIRHAGIMEWSVVQRVVQDFRAGNGALATPLWFLLAFEMWHECWC